MAYLENKITNSVVLKCVTANYRNTDKLPIKEPEAPE